MTDADLDAFADAIDALYQHHALVLEGDSAIEAMLFGVAALVRRQRANETDPMVTALLDNVAEKLDDAAMDYYVSLK